MNKCHWEEIHGFESPGEFDRFYTWLSAQIDVGVTQNIPVKKPSADLICGLEERWYLCVCSGEVWRLVLPQSPFRGEWRPLTESYWNSRL